MSEPSHGQAGPSSLLGRTVGGYCLEAVIGAGGMATVYRGAREPDGERVAVAAIKVLNPELAGDPSFVKRFRREARAAKRLKHPASVEIFGFGVEGGLPHIAMELCRGAELIRILAHERALPEARAAKIMIQVLGALSAAHELGIVHRDLKPENVMLVRDPTDPSIELAKVLDFGIAKIVELEPRLQADGSTGGDRDTFGGRSALTMAGTLIGTPEYMSPEQSRGVPVDARSDLYTCGVLLYQMVVGRVPFLGASYFDVALKHVQETPRPMREFAPATHPALDALVLRALSKAPADRPPSARAMREDLERLLPELATERHGSAPAILVGAADEDRLSTAQTVVTAPTSRAAGVPQAAPSGPMGWGAQPVTVDPETDPLAVTEHAHEPYESVRSRLALPQTAGRVASAPPAMWVPRGPSSMSAGTALVLGIGVGLLIVVVVAAVAAYVAR